AAIRAVHLLDHIQIAQQVPIDREVVATPHAVDPIDGETEPLIKRDPQASQCQWNDEGMDQRGGERIDQARLAQEREEALLESTLCLADFTVELNRAPVDLISPRGALPAGVAKHRRLG